MPGSIHAPQSKGCHALLKQGAKLVETAQDILEELRGPFRSPFRSPIGNPSGQAALPLQPAASTAPADPVLEALGHDPVTMDALTARTGWSAQDLSAQLLTLELDGQVARLPGGLYQRLHRG